MKKACCLHVFRNMRRECFVFHNTSAGASLYKFCKTTCKHAFFARLLWFPFGFHVCILSFSKAIERAKWISKKTRWNRALSRRSPTLQFYYFVVVPSKFTMARGFQRYPRGQPTWNMMQKKCKK